ncbi:MAG: hypothetical protein AABY22_25400 [Nanoarchaeota archaeon]
MLTPLNITDLDNIRAETMIALLNKEGRKEIWKYDIIRRKTAMQIVVEDSNFDNMEAAQKNKNKPFCLIGPGIDDCYFETVAELISICYWLCCWYLGDRCVNPKEGTYQNQVEFLQQYREEKFPFIPLTI